eukprot:7947836-Heterocapsa_arctica.AAC.1
MEQIDDKLERKELAAQKGLPEPERRVRARLTPMQGCLACSDVSHEAHTAACTKRRRNFEEKQKK